MVQSVSNAMHDRRLYFYDGIAAVFDAVMNPYDLQRRLEVVFDEFLAEHDLADRRVLDVGCGTGWFSQRATQRNANVTSVDIGLSLLAETRIKAGSDLVAADACALPFPDGTFDVVLSSECIEHTLDPQLAAAEICRVTRPGGLVVITVPNRIWRFSATIAAVLKLRPYDGYEHWVGWRELRRVLTRSGVQVRRMRGFHLVPPVWRRTWSLLRRLDDYGGTLGPVMLNIAVMGRKDSPAVASSVPPGRSPGRAPAR
jgi:2-polyprenyl-3-methyl-5-hydroxy-6-metoxy-1,4-benzoquinol methylase